MSPARSDQEFAVYVSFNVEKLTETLNTRADRLCTFLLILLGSAVFGSMASTFWLGAAVAGIAALQFVCRFGEAAGTARAQRQRYASLINRMPNLADGELADQLERIHEHDSRPLASVEAIAYNKACLMSGKVHGAKPLGLIERSMAYFIGGHPCGAHLRPPKQPTAH